jgi:predicted transcriptional regulator
MLHGKTLYIEPDAQLDTIIEALKALGSVPRWRIMQYLAEGKYTINELAEVLKIPPSTAAAHVKILEEAGLIQTELEAASHGLQKVCSRAYDNVLVQLPYLPATSSNVVEVSMPIGAYTSFEVTPTCGLASETSLIGFLDDRLSFYEPERIHAGLIWFRTGYLEYLFPNRLPIGATLVGVQISMEICSEAPLHNHNWPSDITLWINGHQVGTWTCPADFGGQRGMLTPAWWDNKDSQYGLLKRWLICEDGSFIDGHPLSSCSIRDLQIDQQRVIVVRVGIEPDALHVGGINLFGHSFGNYPQDLTLRLEYVPAKRADVNNASPAMMTINMEEEGGDLRSNLIIGRFQRTT